MTPQILRLSNLPCIDDVEVNDSEVDGGGGGAIEAPRGKGGVAPTPNDDEREDYQPPRQWGEVEVRAITRLRCLCLLFVFSSDQETIKPTFRYEHRPKLARHFVFSIE